MKEQFERWYPEDITARNGAVLTTKYIAETHYDALRKKYDTIAWNLDGSLEAINRISAERDALSAKFDAQVNAGMVLFEQNEQLRAERDALAAVLAATRDLTVPGSARAFAKVEARVQTLAGELEDSQRRQHRAESQTEQILTAKVKAEARVKALEAALKHVRASATTRDVGVVISYAAFSAVRDALDTSAPETQGEHCG